MIPKGFHVPVELINVGDSVCSIWSPISVRTLFVAPAPRQTGRLLLMKCWSAAMHQSEWASFARCALAS